MDSVGSSIKSILGGKKVRQRSGTSVNSDIPWSEFRIRGRLRRNSTKLARSYGLHAFKICDSIDSLDKSRVSKHFEAFMVCNLA